MELASSVLLAREENAQRRELASSVLLAREENAQRRELASSVLLTFRTVAAEDEPHIYTYSAADGAPEPLNKCTAWIQHRREHFMETHTSDSLLQSSV